MNYSISEQKALKKLKISSFTHMTKDKLVQFVSMLDKMDPEVAKAAINQFPNFKELATEIVTSYERQLSQILQTNESSSQAFYSACQSIIDSLHEQLKDENIDPDEKSRISRDMITVAQMMSDKDTENKNFLLKIGGIMAAVAVTLGAIGATILGGNVSLPLKHTDDDDDDEEQI